MNIGSLRQWIVVLAVATTFMGSNASATLLLSDFDFDISAYEETFLSEDASGSTHLCGDPIVEMVRHRTPFVRLRNTSTNTFFSTELTLGDLSYNFGDDFGVGVFSDLDSVQAIYTNATGGDPTAPIINGIQDDRDRVVLDFGPNGLQPGEQVTFRLSLNPDAGNPDFFPDFRDVLLSGVGDPTLVINSNLVGMEVSTFALTPPLDQNSLGALSAPIGPTRSAVGGTPPVVSFGFGFVPNVVPEPGSAVLVLGLICGLAGVKQRG